MAAPITHTVLTNKAFNKYFKDKKKNKFLLEQIFQILGILRLLKEKKRIF